MPKKTEKRVKQIETFERFGVRYLIAVTEDGQIFSTIFGSGTWYVILAPSQGKGKKRNLK